MARHRRGRKDQFRSPSAHQSSAQSSGNGNRYRNKDEYRNREQPSGYTYGSRLSDIEGLDGFTVLVEVEFGVARVDKFGRAFLAKCLKEAGIKRVHLNFEIGLAGCYLRFSRRSDCRSPECPSAARVQ